MRHTKSTTPQTESERLTELKLRIWGHVANELLLNKITLSDKHTIPVSSIESNRGRRDKAVRDLRGLISYAGSTKPTNNYGRVEAVYQIHDYETQSADLAVAPVFMTTWQEYHDEIFSRYSDIDSQKEIDQLGYIEVGSLKPAEKLYVYWHQDEYDLNTNEGFVRVYPKALIETRTKAMLRAIVEQHYQDDYTTKLERYLDLPTGSLKTEDTYDLHIRNYCARAADLSESRYYGPKGYQEEYKHYQLYFEALQYNLNKLAARIIEKGGYENIIRDMRLASIETLLTNAPLHINVCDDLPLEHLTHTARNKVKYESPYLNTFLLRHSEYFDYESLYATDTTVSYIDGNQAALHEDEKQKHEYVPNEDEASIINAYLKESSCTSPKTTSVV